MGLYQLQLRLAFPIVGLASQGIHPTDWLITHGVRCLYHPALITHHFLPAESLQDHQRICFRLKWLCYHTKECIILWAYSSLYLAAGGLGERIAVQVTKMLSYLLEWIFSTASCCRWVGGDSDRFSDEAYLQVIVSPYQELYRTSGHSNLLLSCRWLGMIGSRPKWSKLHHPLRNGFPALQTTKEWHSHRGIYPLLHLILHYRS